MPEIKLSDNFYLSEFVDSNTALRRGIDNTPPDYAVNNLRKVALLLQAIRNKVGQPIVITSGYRCDKLNQAVGGSRNSDHMRGSAADIICPRFGTPRELARKIIDSGIPFGQLIWEGDWVHISIEPKDAVNRVLTATFKDGKVTYTPGI